LDQRALARQRADQRGWLGTDAERLTDLPQALHAVIQV